MKKNAKCLIATGLVAVSLAVPTAANANETQGHYLEIDKTCIIMNGTDCVANPGTGSHGRIAEGTIRSQGWSTHTIRNHRPNMRVDNTLHRPANFRPANIRNTTIWVTHRVGASITTSFEVQ